jgi:outer membrane receptor protein involved in Fe transport
MVKRPNLVAGTATYSRQALFQPKLRIVVIAVALGCLVFGSRISAEDDVGPVVLTDEIDEIIVTGTRIARRDYESASPIVTVDASLFEQNGSPTVEAMLNTLPQFAPWFTENTNNRAGPDSGGQAVMDLRGMGLGRTLVLLDGRRIVPSNPWGSVDVNLIPPAVIDTVEIISGGASAVYGSDAISGVVNLKTREFKGLRADASWEQTDRNDGTGTHVGITGGFEFDRGYAYGHLSYAERDPVVRGDRDFSSISVDYDPDTGEFVPLGSNTIRQGRWDPLFLNLPTQEAIDTYLSSVDPSYVPGAVTPLTPLGFNPDGSQFSIQPVFNFTGDVNEPLQPVNPDYYTYNFAPVNYLRNADTELFAQLLWASYTPEKQLAPTPLVGTYIGADNPFIQPEFATLLASRPDPDGPFRFRKRMTDIGSRISHDDYDVLQVLVGVEGNLRLADGWRYEVYGSWGDVDHSNTKMGNVSRKAFEELSMASDAGASICGGEGMNPFGINSISSECAAYFARAASQSTAVSHMIAEAIVSGPLVEMPAGDVQAAIGLMYKDDEYDFRPDESLSARRIDPVFNRDVADISGFNPADAVAGSTDSREIFIEANFPLISDARFAQSLELALGYRYADHSNSGGIDAYKSEAIWKLAEPWTVRASFQHAVRAPDIGSLYKPQVTGLINILQQGEPCESDYDDPWDEILGAQQDSDIAALCIAQGIPATVLSSFVDTDKAIENVSGGNPALQEEGADTVTMGLVFESPWNGALARFRASIDYYRIEMEDVIGFASLPHRRCYDRAFNPDLDPDNFYCRRFRRDAITYEIVDVLNTVANVGVMETSGYDLQVDYAVDAGPGQIELHGVGTYVEQALQQAAPGVPVEQFHGKATFAGATAQSAVFTLVPRWKWAADVSYAVGAFDGRLRWQYIDGMSDKQVETFKLPSRDYFDLTLGYSFESGSLDGFSIRVGVTNLTDEKPVVYPSSVEANTESSVYDVLGRRYFLRATYTF